MRQICLALCLRAVGVGSRIAIASDMKSIIVLLALLISTSCVRKVDVDPQIVRGPKYSYIKDSDGRVYIVTTNTKDFDEAMKKLHPGPSSVDKLNLWVITPLKKPPKE